MASEQDIAIDLISKIPTGGPLSLATFGPLVAELVKNAADVEGLPGAQRKALVVDCLKLLAARLPFPESAIIPLLIESVAPPLIDTLVKAAKKAEIAVEDLLTQHKVTPVSMPPAPASKIGRRYCLRRQPCDKRDLVYLPFHLKPKLPAKVDLGPLCLPAVDQQNIGSCSANSAAVILRYLLRKEKVGDWLPSRLFLYYNTRVHVEHTPAADDSGAVLRDVAKALSLYHDCPEQYWPYDTTKFSAPPSALAIAKANLHKRLQYMSVPQDLVAFKTALAEGYPLHIGISVFESFESDSVAQTGIVPMPGTNENCLGGHALAVVGYDDNKRCFTVLNSWGTSWGNNGLCYIPYEYLMHPDIGSVDT